MIANASQHKIVGRLNEARNFNSSEYLLSDLKGDSFDYIIEGTVVGGLLGIELGGDGTSNYRGYYMRGLSSTASALVNDATIVNDVIGSTDTDKPSAFRLIVTGDSSTERFINGLASVTGGVYVRAIYWKNTAVELDSIGLFDTVSRTTTVDFRIYQIPKQSNLDNYDLVEVVDFVSRSLNTNPIILDSLDGNNDGEYLINCETSSIVGTGAFKLDINGDFGSNYTTQQLKNINGSVSAANFTNQTSCLSDYNSTLNAPQIVEFRIDAISGRKRLINCSTSRKDGGTSQQIEMACWYDNTVDNVTSIHIADVSNIVSTGTIKLYKRKSNKSIDPVLMETAKVIDVAGNFSAGQTVNNIQGDRIEGAIKLEYTGVGNADIEVQFNSITSNTNQQLKGSGTSATATSSSPTKIKLCGGSSDTTNTNSGVMWIYPKSGQNRPCLGEQSYNSNTLEKNAVWINDDVNEIVSMTFTASNTNTMDGEIRCSYPKNTKQSTPSWT